jgi:hypothetical protein
MKPTQERERSESIQKTPQTPLRSIRKYCLWCMNDQAVEVKLCPDRECPLYDLRMGKKAEGKKPLKQIRERCKVCSESLDDIKNCLFNGKDSPECSLFPYRMGKNFRLKGKGNVKSLIFAKKHRPATDFPDLLYGAV